MDIFLGSLLALIHFFITAINIFLHHKKNLHLWKRKCILWNTFWLDVKMSNWLFYWTSYNEHKFFIVYLQTQRKLCSNPSLMYSFSTLVNTQKSISYKVFSIRFNFFRQSTTFRWGWQKEIMHSRSKLLGIFYFISHFS